MTPKRFLALLVLAFAFFSAPASALRCGTRLILNGAQDFQVRERCGAPFWTDRYATVEVVGAYGPVERQREIDLAVWYYNFGPSSLMQRLVFRDGVLQNVESLGYGVSEVGTNCDAQANYSGLTIGELVARCGEPASRRRYDDTIVTRPAPGIERYRDERREDWIYDFDDTRFVRIYRVANGQVQSRDLVPK